ncbi:MAG TPA: 30S ribosomal protein S17e [Candidatus Nanoarchaeia archaeon]|nr:30S ribosomal protein S17e [Candidatus Nanoarchaeia archaeon]
MGRIKTQLIKSKSQEIVKKYPGEFSKDFNQNKEKLGALAEVRSKKLRNVMAGYITRLSSRSE